MRLTDAWPEFPKLASYNASCGAKQCGTWRRDGLTQIAPCLRGNVALAGDASGSVDAITGEGLCLSFRHALALADALSKGKLLSTNECTVSSRDGRTQWVGSC